MALLPPVTSLIHRLGANAFSLSTARTMSAQQSSEMVNQMVQFARTTCQEHPQQALDVLQTGLPHQDRSGQNRLYLAMAEVETGRSNWAAVTDHAEMITGRKTEAKMSNSAAQVQAEAFDVNLRALLIQGRDKQAAELAQEAVEQVPTWFAFTDRPLEQQAQLKATANLLRTQHALGNANGAENSCQMALALIHEGDISVEQGGLSAAAVAGAYNQAASLGFAQGRAEEAGELYREAVKAAHSWVRETDPDGLLPASAALEQAAACEVGRAQLSMSQQAWQDAEEALSSALQMIESAHGDSTDHPTVGIALGLLGHVYARSKRITLAEGLHRQAVKLLQLNEATSRQHAPLTVHSSLAATAAWRYAQLLTALPKRETEASLWRKYADQQHSFSPSMAPLQEVLGPLESLKGRDGGSTGVILDLALRRALPCF